MASVAIGLDSKLKNYINSYRAKGEQPPLLKEHLEKYGAEIVPKFISYLKLETDRAIFFGKLDDCLILGGKLYAPLDHKTRASFTDTLHETYQIQMDAYDWLLRANGFPAAGKAYLAYYAPLDGELHNGFPFGVDFKELETSPERAEKLFNNALAVIASDEPPVASPQCSFCKYRKVEY